VAIVLGQTQQLFYLDKVVDNEQITLLFELSDPSKKPVAVDASPSKKGQAILVPIRKMHQVTYKNGSFFLIFTGRHLQGVVGI
jgi:hypothetical protein